MLFHLIIVDDEPTLRKGLSKFIPWSHNDCCIDGVAEDGKEAIELIEKCKPDIVITDVKMPQMDGIELTKYLYHTYPKIKVIILTGYAEFSYAQSAIKYQVADFILKPSSKEKLLHAVQTCKNQIINERKLNIAATKEISLVKEQFLVYLTSGLLKNEDDILIRLEEFNINLNSYYLVIFQFSQECYYDVCENFNSLEQILTKENSNNHCFKYNNNFIVVLYSLCNQNIETIEDLKKICTDAMDFILNLYGIILVSGSSPKFYGLNNGLNSAYNLALIALSNCFYEDSGFCIYTPSNKEEQIDTEYILFLYDLEDTIRSYNFELAQSSIAKLFNMFKVNFVKSSDAKNICCHVFYICSRILIKKELEALPSGILDNIYNASNLYTLQSIIENLILCVKNSIIKSGKLLSPFIEKAVYYIHNNLNKNLSLDTISEYVHINSSYLSRVFKKECNSTITDFINQQRIELAKDLLISGKVLAYEVAEMVGYNDPAYFSIMFKKFTGQTPKEFKNTCKTN